MKAVALAPAIRDNAYPVGEELQSRFWLVTLIGQRAAQLKNGARPRVDPGHHKFLRVAMLEVMGGKMSWTVSAKVPTPAQ